MLTGTGAEQEQQLEVRRAVFVVLAVRVLSFVVVCRRWSICLMLVMSSSTNYFGVDDHEVFKLQYNEIS